MRGDESHGWDRNSPMLADIADTLTVIARGLAGKKVGPEMLVRRPKPPSDEGKRRPATIADFDVAWFMRQL